MDLIYSLGNIIPATLTTVACLAALYIYYDSKNKHNYWTERGIKGPKPLPFVGNLVALLTGNRLMKELNWVKEYGKVYGIYQGNNPLLVVADPEILMQICIKDFETFPNHSKLEFVHKYLGNSLFSQRDQDWKQARTLMSPTFTSGKIRRMFRFLDSCADDMVQSFNVELTKQNGNSHEKQQQKSAVVNVKDQFNLYTMDSIATCCYGLKLERAGATNLTNAATKDDFVNEAMKVFKFNIFRFAIAFVLPHPLLRLIGFQINPDSELEPFAHKLQRLIDQRRAASTEKKFDDYLQILIDAKLDDQLEVDAMDSAENHHTAQGTWDDSLTKNQTKSMGDDIVGPSGSLTDFEILANALTLMVVGLETTGSTLAHCTYALAFHSEIQDRLYEEIIKIGQFDQANRKYRFEFDSVTSCKYLDAVLAETLRLMSPVVQIDRQSVRSYYLKKYNLALPQESKLNLAFYAVHNDPDYWPQPSQFKPERFLPDNRDKIVPGSYCPFGIGPRHCLGMRFSLTESKLALAKLVVNFRFRPAPGTKFPPEPKKLFGLNNIETPFISVTPRN